MDDPTLTRLLQLVDDPAPDPTDFKNALRAQLQVTLERNAPASAVTNDGYVSEQVITLETPDPRSRGRVSPFVAVAAVASLIVAVGIVLTTLSTGSPDTEVARPATSATTRPPPPSTDSPTIEAACAAYATAAPAFDELEPFAEPTAASGTGMWISLSRWLRPAIGWPTNRPLPGAMSPGCAITSPPDAHRDT